MGQYYAHPQNAFWPIMRELIGAEGSYEERCAALKGSGIALWDVLRLSVRPGSMDADIRLDTAVANDFQALLTDCPRIRRICFNGRKAEQMFHRFVRLQAGAGPMDFRLLPSTSPAYAAMSFAEKLERWQRALSGHARGQQ